MATALFSCESCPRASNVTEMCTVETVDRADATGPVEAAAACSRGANGMSHTTCVGHAMLGRAEQDAAERGAAQQRGAWRRAAQRRGAVWRGGGLRLGGAGFGREEERGEGSRAERGSWAGRGGGAADKGGGGGGGGRCAMRLGGAAFVRAGSAGIGEDSPRRGGGQETGGTRPYNQQAGEWTGGGATATTLLSVALLSCRAQPLGRGKAHEEEAG